MCVDVSDASARQRLLNLSIDPAEWPCTDEGRTVSTVRLMRTPCDIRVDILGKCDVAALGIGARLQIRRGGRRKERVIMPRMAVVIKEECIAASLGSRLWY